MAKLSVSDWDTTAANNTDINSLPIDGAVTTANQIDDIFRELMAEVAAYTRRGADLASASTLNLDSIDTVFLDISGTTTVTAVTLTAGHNRRARAQGVFTLTAGASLIVNGSTSVNYTTTAGDLLFFEGYGSSVVRVWAFPAALFALYAAGSLARLDLAAQVVTGGARVTSNAVGTITSGTVTLDPGTRPLWDLTNGGAFTLAPGANTGSILLDITNNGSAGAITTSGFTKIVGAFDTVNGHKFRCVASIGAAGSLLSIQALQ